MKTILSLLIVAVTTLGCAQNLLPTTPEWKITLRTVDEIGQPVQNAQVDVEYTVPRSPDKVGSVKGNTDTNGLFTASGRSYSRLYLNVKKTGYYSAGRNYDIYVTDKPRYEPWNPTISLTLKKIGKPIPMYAKSQEMPFQELDKSTGFDLEYGDWVTPNGKGFHADILFKAHREIKNRREFNAELSVTFPNQGDGIAVAPAEAEADGTFKLMRTAAENDYQPKLNLQYSNTNQPPSVLGYFIRVRTELNSDGTVKSALYGKIAGNFRFYAGTIKPTSAMGFTYYLNPTPNDHNVEFDRGKNLIRDMKPDEQVKSP